MNDLNIYKFTDKHFLKYCSVEGIDFKCLYKSLKDSKRNSYKYPCLLRVSEPARIHGIVPD